MAKKQGQGHSKLASWLGKTIALLAILGIGAGVIYHIMPDSQRKLVNQITDNRASKVNQQATVQEPKDFEQATAYLKQDRPVPIQNVQVDVNGNLTGTINGQTVQKHLASIGMVGTNSRFYQENSSGIQGLLNSTVHPNGKVSYTVQEAKDHDFYLFVNGTMLQQTWLERGLAYIKVPRGYDAESSTLYTAQGNAQNNGSNIWQVNQAVQGTPQRGYYFNSSAENEYLNNQKATFSAQGQSTNFWGKAKHLLR